MRRGLRKLLPIVLLALAVQIVAPIAACWAVSIAASDPLQAAVICHDDAAAPGQADQPGHRAHDGCCSVCNLAHTAALPGSPQPATAATPYLRSSRVVWLDRAPDLFSSRAGSHAQARAPPQLT
jgi:cytochrome c5